MSHDPTKCPCGCHDGYDNPCTIPGGCGLHQPASPAVLERPADCAAIACPVCGKLAHPIGGDCRRLAREADRAARAEAKARGWNPSDITPDPRHNCPVRTQHLGQTCRRCHDRLLEQLAELPELYALALGEMNLGSGGSSTGRSTEPSIGLRVAALDLRAASDLTVLPTLVAWLDDWVDQFGHAFLLGTTRPDTWKDNQGATFVRVCNDLRHGLAQACAAYPDMAKFAKAITRIHSEARTAARTTGARSAQVDCPADIGTDGAICGAPLRLAGLNLDDHIYCRRCQTRWGIRRLLLVATSDATATVWLPVDDVALLLGISRATLNRWAKADRIRREHGLLDVGSVRDAIAENITTRHASAARQGREPGSGVRSDY